MRGQAFFSESVQALSPEGTGCSEYNGTKMSISCSASWQNDEAEGYELAVAENGFGEMRAYAYSSITSGVDGFDGRDVGHGSNFIQDHLSILGLTGQPTAFLNLEFECLECAKPGNISVAEYQGEAATNGVPLQLCTIPNSPVKDPICTLTVPIVYDGCVTEPCTVYLERDLEINAITNVVNEPAGATVTTSVCVGYAKGGCGTAGATVKASVVDANGKVIKGVTVAGSSGHIYN
jgi:hypothetical protein